MEKVINKFTLERIGIHATSRHAGKKIQKKTYGGVSFVGVQIVRHRGANKGTLEAESFLLQGGYSSHFFCGVNDQKASEKPACHDHCGDYPVEMSISCRGGKTCVFLL